MSKIEREHNSSARQIAGPHTLWLEPEHDDPIYAEYHDREWGVPVYDDQKHFEFLTLESAQAGLSWLTVLRKREGYRKAFADFDAARVARFTDQAD